MGVYFDIPSLYKEKIDSIALRKNIELLLIKLQIPETTEFSIAFVDDQAIQKLNLEFRDVDAPTDVLSFPVNEMNPEDNTEYIGDIIISMDTSHKQAEDQGISPMDEIHLLVIHGILHLLGYDHDNEENKHAMWLVQSDLLQTLHCPADPDRYSL